MGKKSLINRARKSGENKRQNKLFLSEGKQPKEVIVLAIYNFKWPKSTVFHIVTFGNIYYGPSYVLSRSIFVCK